MPEIRKPEVKGSSPFAGSIEIKQLQAPSGCLFWFVDINVDRLGMGRAAHRGAAFFILCGGDFGAELSGSGLGTSGARQLSAGRRV